jgi:hypothetical protein
LVLAVFVHAKTRLSDRISDILGKTMDQKDRTEIEAAVFRRLIDHFQQHTEVQNIELMILADFCRNCLAKWYTTAANEKDIELDYEQAREIIYGMPYSEWKEKFQAKATSEQLSAYEKRQQNK